MRFLTPVLLLALAGTVVSQSAQAQEQQETMPDSIIYQGNFRGVAGHDAGGGYEVVLRDGRYVVRMTESFASEKVPDGHVYLSNHAESLGRDAYHVNRLIRRNGEQEYLLPEDIDPTAFKFLLVWCVRFNVGVAAGPLAT
jgi:hypothetical protein